MSKSPKYRGKIQVRRASDFASPYRLRRPTGVMGLDIALAGGFPAGGGSQIWGRGSSGKTYLAFCVAGQVQRNYGEDAVIAIGITEIRLDKGFARTAGFCIAYSDYEIKEFETIRKSNGLPPFTKEERADLRKQIGEVIPITGETGDAVLDGTIKVLEDMGNACQLLILESLGALLTPDQDKKDVGDRVYGGSSGLITTWQNKIYPLYMMDGDDGMLETTIIGINQVRAVIDGGPRGPKERPAAGAKAWEHAQLTSVQLKPGEVLYGDAAHTTKVGRVVRWELVKGKAGTHDGRKGEYNWHHIEQPDPVFWKDVEFMSSTWGIDTITDLVDAARKVGAIDASGTWLKMLDENNNVEAKAQGVENFADLVVNDGTLEHRLRERCLRKANLMVRYS